MLFNDRHQAALMLLPSLEKYRQEGSAVFAVPRGGVPIGYEISKAFDLPLELLMTKKIGHPLNSEVAIGAVGLEDAFVVNTKGIAQRYIDEQITSIQKSLHARYRRFMGDRLPMNPENKTVIITDDGIATGNTIMGEIRMLREKHPKKIVIAVPVAPVETVRKLKKIVDDFICLHEAEHFVGVGHYYNDFSEVSDEEVVSFLKDANKREAMA